MARRLFTICFIFTVILSLSGCVTAGKKRNLEIQGLQNQVSALETQLREKDQEITDLKESLDRLQEEKTEGKGTSLSKGRIIGEVKSRPNTKQIQIALKNAGYNPGAIDGKMGRRTRDAIKAFQRDRNLSVDGRVGKATWKLLRKYLYSKIK